MHATRTVATALALLLAAAPTLAQQQRVYQWKDANGVTHYTDLPPTQAHQRRDIDNRGSATEIATVKPAENEQCTNSRSNLTRLQTNQAVGVDTDGDGKSDRTLSSDERASQIELNQAAIKAYCPASKP